MFEKIVACSTGRGGVFFATALILGWLGVTRARAACTCDDG